MRIKGLRVSLAFAFSPLLSFDSIKYLADNIGTPAIVNPIITFHADVYAKLTNAENYPLWKLQKDILEDAGFSVASA